MSPRRAPGLERLARKIIRAVPGHRNDSSRVVVYYLPNQELRRLKRQFLKHDAVFVNVLAFPESKTGFKEPRLSRTPCMGEVYLNEEYANGSLHERREMLIHGVLHLLGFSHDLKRDTMDMELLEERLMQRFS